MDKYLCIVVGQDYLKPMVVYGNNAIELLKNYSKDYPYIYVLYLYNNVTGSYVPVYKIHNGLVNDIYGCKVNGVNVR